MPRVAAAAPEESLQAGFNLECAPVGSERAYHVLQLAVLVAGRPSLGSLAFYFLQGQQAINNCRRQTAKKRKNFFALGEY